MQAEITDYVERLRIQREEGRYAIYKQTANIDAFQVEKQAEVSIAGVEYEGNFCPDCGANAEVEILQKTSSEQSLAQKQKIYQQSVQIPPIKPQKKKKYFICDMRLKSQTLLGRIS